MLIFDTLETDLAQVVIGELRLSFDWRQKARFRAPLVSGPRAGEDVGVRVPRGRVLREGDLLSSVAADGRRETVRIRAAAEQLLQVTAADDHGLMRIAYHLGNRHVPVEIGRLVEDGREQLWLRLQLDHVLENMVEGLGGRIEVLSAPFSPESGAYSHDHGPLDHASADRSAGLTPDSTPDAKVPKQGVPGLAGADSNSDEHHVAPGHRASGHGVPDAGAPKHGETAGAQPAEADSARLADRRHSPKIHDFLD